MSQEEFEQFRQKELSVIQKMQARVLKFQQQASVDGLEEFKKEAFLKNAQSSEEALQYHQKRLELAHPENPAEISEKRRIWTTYDKIIAETISDENPVFFHGVKNLGSLESILSSGHLGYLEYEQTKSQTSPGGLATTTKDSINTTLGFLGLESSGFDKFIPAGCLFVIAPKDEQEKEFARQDTGSEHEIKTVDFKTNPERIISIVSTTQNQDYIKGLAKKYDLSEDIVCSFDDFIERMQQKNKEGGMEKSSHQGEGPNITQILRQQKALGDAKEMMIQKRQNEMIGK